MKTNAQSNFFQEVRLMQLWLRKIIAVMMTIIIIAGIFSISGLALTSDHDNPLTVEIVAKDSYSLMETGSITIKATNTGKTDLNNVVVTADSNDLLFLNKNGQKSYSIGKLEKGKSATWTVQVILSSNCNGLGFFQRILLTFKKWFTPCSAFSKGYDNNEQAISMANKQINYSGLNASLNAYAYYDGARIVDATDINSYSAAVSDLVNAQMKSGSFNSYAASQNDYYSARIVIKGKNIDFEDCNANTIIAGPDDTFIVQFDSSAEAIAFETNQKGKPNVDYVEPDKFIKIDPIEKGTEITSTNSSYNSWGVEHIEADVFSNYLKSNNYTSDITVAVVDTGVDNTHNFLRNKLVEGYDYVDGDNTPYEDYRGTGHGTHVSGTIIDCTPGLNVKIMPVRVLGLDGGGYDSEVAAGIKYAASSGAKVINLSLGGGHSDKIDDAVTYATGKKVTVCVAAGNENQNTSNVCPAHITVAGCICVSAINNSNTKASFSNYGAAVEVAAPGVDIKSCVPGGLYASWNGTSMATPHISACAAMLKLLYPSASPSQIENYIRQYTQDIGTFGRDNYFGYGVSKMSKAIPKTNYTVTYNANGGTVSPASTTVESGSSVSLPTPTRSYTITYNANSGSGAPSNQNLNASCKGWSTSSSATSASYNCGSSYTPMSSITLYAVWGNATGNVTTAKPTRTGYSFAGWSTSSSAAAVEYTAGSSISINRNVTLYAVWSRNPSTYTITYNANGGSNPPASQTKTENIDLVLSTVMPTRTGYTFLGWSTNSSATSPTYPAGGTYTANASATLYAVWKINTYTISYNANGGSGAPSSQTKTYGQSLTLSSTKPTRTGYDFLGWSTSSSATSATYTAGGTYTANASATLYAVWKIKTYTITYNNNGGTTGGTNASQTKTHGQNITIQYTYEPSRDGYCFLGWSTNSNATSRQYWYGDTYSANSSATLYAVWEKRYINLSSYSGSITVAKNKVTVDLANANPCEYIESQNYTGYKVSVPNVTVSSNNGDLWVCYKGWEVYSGDAVVMYNNGNPYLVVKNSGTIKLRYRWGNYVSNIYTYNITLT